VSPVRAFAGVTLRRSAPPGRHFSDSSTRVPQWRSDMVCRAAPQAAGAVP
jgi:hypothetical protein